MFWKQRQNIFLSFFYKYPHMPLKPWRDASPSREGSNSCMGGTKFVVQHAGEGPPQTCTAYSSRQMARFTVLASDRVF